MPMPNNRWLARILEVLNGLADGSISVATTGGGAGGTLHDGTGLAPAVAAPLTASVTVTTVLVQADPDNTVSVFVGNAASQSVELVPGQGETLPVNDPSLIYIQSAGGAGRVNWHAVGA